MKQQETDCLNTATFTELWKELSSRCTGVVFVYDREADGDGSQTMLQVLYKGCSQAHCLGLVQHADMQLRNDCNPIMVVEGEDDG